MFLLQAIPERQPALLSLVFVGGLALMAMWLLLSLFRGGRRRSSLAAVAADLPSEVRARLGATSTNRGLRALRWVFVLLAMGVFGFHYYWAREAPESNERFQQLSYKDLRNRRLAESTLRGWILDRNGKLEDAVALYRAGGGQIRREYPLDRAMAHLLGSDRGDAGLERALFGIESGAAPEALDVALNRNLKQAGNLDVRLTIDAELQKAAVEQLRGRAGAVVALNPQTGEVLAMYSNPSYSLNEVQDGAATWIRLEADKRDSPLVNRTLASYYIPGSTFKTVTMIAATIAGRQSEQLVCSGGGYIAQRGANPIYDDQGPSEVHGRIGIDTAYEVSCNQYFAQMAVRLGADRMKQAAQLLGIGAYDEPSDALRGRKRPDIWNASSTAVARALAPRESTMVLFPGMRPFDLALEGYGQGYAGQMTPFQMALNASAIANTNGRLMKPKLEYDLAPQMFNQVLNPQQAAELRRVMGLVTGGSSGTARGVFAPVHAAGIITGGKTGTAQKVVPVYDPKTGEPKTRLRVEKDRKGNVIRQYEEVVMDNDNPRIDGWFLCIAPLENPQLAMAVIIEGGGYGSRSAAPVSAARALKAGPLGLLGNVPRSNRQDEQPNAPNRRQNRSRQTAQR